MAKRKKKPTSEQLKALAAKLIDTRSNAYNIAKTLGFELDEEGWDIMVEQEKLFRCEECSLWQSITERQYAGSDVCNDCACVRDSDEDFDE